MENSTGWIPIPDRYRRQIYHNRTLCLTIAWAVKKCLSGIDHFTVITDHNPLVPILNSHRLDEIENPRLLRLRTRLMAYNFTALWLKGILNCAADALSRHPFNEPSEGDDLAEYDINSKKALSIAQIRASTEDPSNQPSFNNAQQSARSTPRHSTLPSESTSHNLLAPH